MNKMPATPQDVTRLFGAVSDHTLLKVIETGATLEQLEQVAMWLAQEDDVMGEALRPLTGVPAEILEWLERDEGFPEEEPR
jgi:hypothetical protein